jgi:hypothetical protein
MAQIVWFADDDRDIALAASLLAERAVTNDERALFVASLPTFVSQSPPFRLLLGASEKPLTHPSDISVAGLVTYFDTPLLEEKFLAIDRLWFASADPSTQQLVLQHLVEFAQRLDFAGICLSETATNTQTFYASLLNFARGRGLRIGLQYLALVASAPGLSSSFCPGPLPDSIFFANCIVMYTVEPGVDLSGVHVSENVGWCYRGERPTSNEASDRASLDQILTKLAEDGIEPRVDGEFSGDLPSQMKHQGYVDQATVSLTTDLDTAGLYATGGRIRDSGLVFVIDVHALTAATEVYSGLDTLHRHCEWIQPASHEVLHEALKAVGMRVGGHFLEVCYSLSRQKAQEWHQGLEWPTDTTDWATVVPDEKAAALIKKIPAPKLEDLLRDLGDCWAAALGFFGSVETIDAESGVASTKSMVREPFLCQAVFEQLRPELEAAMSVGKRPGSHRIGWDLTAFGYIAKTVLDDELFPAGRVPTTAITSALVVDRSGNVLQDVAIR